MLDYQVTEKGDKLKYNRFYFVPSSCQSNIINKTINTPLHLIINDRPYFKKLSNLKQFIESHKFGWDAMVVKKTYTGWQVYNFIPSIEWVPNKKVLTINNSHKYSYIKVT